MDFTPIIHAALKPLIWALPFIIFIGVLRTPKVKGIIGEALVKLLAKIKLPKDVYHPIHNVTLPTEDGTTQIDHIFVSPFGVFVVETKNMKGWIFGSENQAQWTQQIFKVKNRFQNPIRQNYKHLKTLESALEIPSEVMVSVIAFIGDCSLKTEMPPNVTRGIGYIDYIKSFTSPVLSEAQVQSVVAQIESGRLVPSGKTDREHVKNLKSRHESEPSMVCSNCGSSMVLRTAKKGANSGKQFWGCSGYPKCRAVQKIN